MGSSEEQLVRREQCRRCRRLSRPGFGAWRGTLPGRRRGHGRRGALLPGDSELLLPGNQAGCQCPSHRMAATDYGRHCVVDEPSRPRPIVVTVGHANSARGRTKHRIAVSQYSSLEGVCHGFSLPRFHGRAGMGGRLDTWTYDPIAASGRFAAGGHTGKHLAPRTAAHADRVVCAAGHPAVVSRGIGVVPRRAECHCSPGHAFRRSSAIGEITSRRFEREGVTGGVCQRACTRIAISATVWRQNLARLGAGWAPTGASLAWKRLVSEKPVKLVAVAPGVSALL